MSRDSWIKEKFIFNRRCPRCRRRGFLNSLITWRTHLWKKLFFTSSLHWIRGLRKTKRKCHRCTEKIAWIDPLYDPVTWYGINYARTQITQWDFQNKGTIQAEFRFVFEVPLHYLRPSIIYSVPFDRILQRAYWAIKQLTAVAQT